MTRVVVLTVALLLGLGAAPSTIAQARVGVPGCSDDVPVRAMRELITFHSRGKDVRAYLYSPGPDANGAALVMLHGGTGFEMNAILLDAHAIQLASRGYRVLLPAYFDAAAPDASRRTVTARAWRQAALDAVDALRSEPGVARDRVALWGYSRGAGVALDAVTQPGSDIRAAVLVAGGGGLDNSAIPSGLKLVLMYARRDEAVPPAATRRLAEVLRDAGATVDLQELEFDGHQYDLPTWCAVMARTRSLLETLGHGPS